MSDPQRLTILCLGSEVKGHEFLRECKRQGCRVLLLTRLSLRDGEWPREAIDEFFYLPSLLNRDELVKGVNYLARGETIDRIVPLDDFDVDLAALLREHLRIPGMGDTTARYFRDKLAMRLKAREEGILVPDFVHAVNDVAVTRFTEQVPPPWVLKPRSEGSAAGIRKARSADELWRILHEVGDERSGFVLEQFVPGDVFHVDSIVTEKKVVFCIASKYGRPPMDVAQGGGVFLTRTLPAKAPEAKAMTPLNRQLIKALGLVRGVTHTEFIRAHADGRYYFLETAARVGGAYIADMIEAATGINLWAEWAKIEIGGGKVPYEVPVPRKDQAGIILSLARQEWPDTSAYDDPEVAHRVHKRQHAGLILVSPDPDRIDALLADYARRFADDFVATAPALAKLER